MLKMIVLRPALPLGPSCNELVYSECCHFENGTKSKIDDVEHGGIPYAYVLTFTIHLTFFGLDK